MKTESKKASRHTKGHVKVQSHPISQYLKKSAAKELANPPEFPQLAHSGK